ncbi:non-specific lipid transfer protein GPI-anchored 10 [Salvia miltiorrhiza]|uniref:non-specific lipid transfer protein GPI-anchored 10 n=1 Tax=Salvia miltiorrhiza TaxID=226208 RepID=UPI0025ACC095|nr:non-specific lipid transfer protein GPI-anchored 10 [Salvia miltiorrhiza]
MPPHHSLPIALLVLFISTPPRPAAALNTVADCGLSLLPLAPCGPFVQGNAPAPVRTCCDSVEKLYKQNVTCLCVLLDNSGPESPLPINTTLALHLPLLCKLNINPSTCPGVSLPSPSPPTHVSLGAKPKSRPRGGISASPMITRSPRPRFGSSGYNHSAEVRMEAETQLLMLLIMAAILFTEIV